MNEQPTNSATNSVTNPAANSATNPAANSANELLENITKQNKKMRKKLIILIAVAIGVVALLVTALLIIRAIQEKDNDFTLPNNYFYPTHKGDIFEYADYLELRPDVIFYCEDPDGLGRTTDN